MSSMVVSWLPSVEPPIFIKITLFNIIKILPDFIGTNEIQDAY